MHINSKPYKTSNWHGKPYFFFGDYLQNKYSSRVLKLSINANLLCPNRDGTIGESGCIFCCHDGSAAPTTLGITDILQQMESARNNFRRSDIYTKYIAYFQAYTNTNAPYDILKKYYDTACAPDDVIGLMVGTRPDCVPDNILNLIASYNRKNFELWLEIGMQTMHNKSLKFLNRKHTHESTRDAILRTAEKKIPVCVHIILGIPGESWNDMMGTAVELSSLPINGIKFHHLHVIKGTDLEKLYKSDKIKMLSLKEYTSTLCDFIERLRTDIIIHRLLGDRNEKSLVAPLWGQHKGTVIQSIEDEFKKRGTHQGFLYPKI